MGDVVKFTNNRGYPGSDVIEIRYFDLYQVTAPDFCAGMEARDDIIWHAAPKLENFIGKSLGKAVEYCRRRGWTVALVPDPRKNRKKPDPAEYGGNVVMLHPRPVASDKD